MTKCTTKCIKFTIYKGYNGFIARYSPIKREEYNCRCVVCREALHNKEKIIIFHFDGYKRYHIKCFSKTGIKDIKDIIKIYELDIDDIKEFLSVNKDYINKVAVAEEI